LSIYCFIVATRPLFEENRVTTAQESQQDAPPSEHAPESLDHPGSVRSDLVSPSTQTSTPSEAEGSESQAEPLHFEPVPQPIYPQPATMPQPPGMQPHGAQDTPSGDPLGAQGPIQPQEQPPHERQRGIPSLPSNYEKAEGSESQAEPLDFEPATMPQPPVMLPPRPSRPEAGPTQQPLGRPTPMNELQISTQPQPDASQAASREASHRHPQGGFLDVSRPLSPSLITPLLPGYSEEAPPEPQPAHSAPPPTDTEEAPPEPQPAHSAPHPTDTVTYITFTFIVYRRSTTRTTTSTFSTTSN
jgi:hypothetical protein